MIAWLVGVSTTDGEPMETRGWIDVLGDDVGDASLRGIVTMPITPAVNPITTRNTAPPGVLVPNQVL